MTYNINKETIINMVEKEISRFAARAYDESGGSLFDSYKILDRDKDVLSVYINTAVTFILTRFSDIATNGGENKIAFNIPDFDDTMDQSVVTVLDEYLIDKTCGHWLAEKEAERSSYYMGKAAADLDRAEVLLKTRKTPKRN